MLVLFTALPAFGSTLTVTNTNDSGPGSLRYAIATSASGDTINFSLTYPATITLLSGTLTITTNLTISGPGASSLFISGNNTYGVFVISAGTSANISGVSIENGNNSFLSGTTVYYYGGGILNEGTLTVTNSTLSGNFSAYAGGIMNDGTLTVTNSVLSGNLIIYGAGCIFNNTGGTVTVTNSTLSGSSAIGDGGCIFNYPGATLTLSKSTLSGNSAGNGGGIYNFGTLTVTNSTISGNSSTGGGGGILADGTYGGTLTVTNSTISGNSAGPFGPTTPGGGAIALYSAFNNTFAVTIKNSILANSPSGGNCSAFSGTITSDGHNLSDDGSCNNFFNQIGDLNSTPTGLDPAGLQNNGGPTQTIALLPTSPAVNAIPLSPMNYCTETDGITPIATDQRGVPRPEGPACDIGAYELVPFLTNGSFVIGNLDATVGDTVEFWGAQWAKHNSLSGGSAPNAFKGFANTAPKSCGGSWTSEPGNSSSPPDSVPTFMTVIASSSVIKSGATVSGDAPTIVIVKTNPGYGPSPGQTGTGTVVAVLCGS